MSPFKITKVHAFIATEDDGTEGIIGMQMNGSWLPFIAADPERMKFLKPYAREISKAAGKEIVIAEFSIRTNLEVIK